MQCLWNSSLVNNGLIMIYSAICNELENVNFEEMHPFSGTQSVCVGWTDGGINLKFAQSLLQLIYDRTDRVNTGNSVEKIHIQNLTALVHTNGIITCANKENYTEITVL